MTSNSICDFFFSAETSCNYFMLSKIEMVLPGTVIAKMPEIMLLDLEFVASTWQGEARAVLQSTAATITPNIGTETVCFFSLLRDFQRRQVHAQPVFCISCPVGKDSSCLLFSSFASLAQIRSQPSLLHFAGRLNVAPISIPRAWTGSGRLWASLGCSVSHLGEGCDFSILQGWGI